MTEPFPVADWVQAANLYEVNLRQYTPEGTFNAFASHLPRLKDMGVEILWLMPVTPVSIKGRQGSLGSYYACSSYTDVNPEFGTLDELKELVAAAHRHRMRVIIDWVANHTGQDHHWTIEHPEWYLKDDAGNFTEKNGWKDVIDLDFTAPGLRDAMVGAMKFWIETCNIDGFRCDMAHLVPLDFWREARIECDSLKSLCWLAECEQVDYHEVFDITYAWWWMHVTEQYRAGEAKLDLIRDVLHAYSEYPAAALKLFFTSNHDENSWNGTEYEKYGDTAKAWAVFALTWERSLPLLYSGQELPNYKRLLFFDKDPVNWSAPVTLHDFYKTLYTLRRTNKAIGAGETILLPAADNNELMIYLRRYEHEVVLVLLNVSAKDRISCELSHEYLTGNFRNLFSGLRFSFNGNPSFELQAGEYFVYVKE
ncbi:alpha-amylase family glycosyl hydrolase [Sediminibacterium ginsengisoli]|uniref:Glycosidase n=1 Tax=Sediminibacterium ginsengisoli TaxID=413434 RepID=A0A1T4QRN3_9BACT|nr:alpha-amylase family glycosyl hydrolase [Sediminibacterium ginsengisoli]SKA06390.1 Glycosidase [Sediminibacterium ginsengisoli]